MALVAVPPQAYGLCPERRELTLGMLPFLVVMITAAPKSGGPSGPKDAGGHLRD